MFLRSMVRAKRPLALGAFEAGVDQRLRRQVADQVERAPHLVRRALDEAAAAHGRQHVAAEQHAGAGQPEGEMAEGMSRHGQHFAGKLPQAELLAAFVGDVDAGNAVGLGRRPVDLAAGGALEREVTGAVW
jgi:hypothetical protein